jgi:hypothetical protein
MLCHTYLFHFVVFDIITEVHGQVARQFILKRKREDGEGHHTNMSHVPNEQNTVIPVRMTVDLWLAVHVQYNCSFLRMRNRTSGSPPNSWPLLQHLKFVYYKIIILDLFEDSFSSSECRRRIMGRQIITKQEGGVKKRLWPDLRY